MANRKVFKLEEVVNIIKAGFQPSEVEDVPYIGLEHIEQQTLRICGIGSSSAVKSNKFRFGSGDILFGKLRPYFRKVVRLKFDGVCSTDIWVIRAKKPFDQGYLFYFLANQDFIESSNLGSSGTRMPRADWNMLKNTEWAIPDLPTQRRIAEILSALDDKIELNRRMNHTLEQMAQTLFKQYFVNKIDEDNLPEGWKSGRLSDVSINVRKSINPKELEEEFQYVGLEHVPRKSIALYEWGSSHELESNKYEFEENNILFGKLRPYFHKVILTPFNGICSTDILVIKPKEEFYLFFCLLHFASDEVVQFSNMFSSGTRMPRADWKSLSRYEIIIPPSHILSAFNDLALPFFEKIKANIREISTLTKTRDALLPKLMSGEIDVMQAQKDYEQVLS